MILNVHYDFLRSWTFFKSQKFIFSNGTYRFKKLVFNFFKRYIVVLNY
jgi:hypothetical protein